MLRLFLFIDFLTQIMFLAPGIDQEHICCSLSSVAFFIPSAQKLSSVYVKPAKMEPLRSPEDSLDLIKCLFVAD